jgi:N-acetyl-gamma-glutamyl-phosphate reductase
VVQDPAHRARADGGGRVRPAGTEPRRHQECAPDRQSGLLSDHDAAGLLSAAEGRPDRCRQPDRRRKSGVSGAGRKAEIGTLFSESSDNFKAYGVSGHRHTPETSAQLQRFTDEKVGLIFTPHLVPMIRGMHATLYARLTKEIDNAALQALFEDAYKDAEFVDVMPFGSHPETRSTRGSNMLRLALHRPEGGDTVVILVVQDNLVKGASGQAVQCMNLMFGLDETLGLGHVPLMP